MPLWPQPNVSQPVHAIASGLAVQRRPEAQYPEAAGHHRYTACSHGESAGPGREQDAVAWVQRAGGEGNHEKIVQCGPRNVHQNASEGHMAEVQHCCDVAYAPLRKHNIGGVQKHAASSKTIVNLQITTINKITRGRGGPVRLADRDTDVGGGHGQRVVEAVAHKRHDVTLLLQRLQAALNSQYNHKLTKFSALKPAQPAACD